MSEVLEETKRWSVYRCPQCGLGNTARFEPEHRRNCGRCGASLAEAEQTAPVTVQVPKDPAQLTVTSQAPLGSRFGARFIDGVLFGLLEWFVISNWENTELLIGLVGFFLLTLVNDWVLVAITGQSVGKMIARVKVVNAQDHAVPPTWGQAFLRWIVFSLPVIGFISTLVLLFREDQRGLHDFAAKTVVVSKSSLS